MRAQQARFSRPVRPGDDQRLARARLEGKPGEQPPPAALERQISAVRRMSLPLAGVNEAAVFDLSSCSPPRRIIYKPRPSLPTATRSARLASLDSFKCRKNAYRRRQDLRVFTR